MKKYCFDIDDTILFSDFIDGKYILMDFDQEMVDIINKLYDDGNEVIIQTGRHWNHLAVTKKQLREKGLKYHTLVMGNMPVDYYINDKGIKPEDFKDEYKRSL
jgi:hydroxymethylpyrimidine pyrophosphatase-like HAD family hydrolase